MTTKNTVKLYGLWIEDIDTKGHSPIGYYDTLGELNTTIDYFIRNKNQLPQRKRLFKVAHDYDEKTNVITEFNYNERIYI